MAPVYEGYSLPKDNSPCSYPAAAQEVEGEDVWVHRDVVTVELLGRGAGQSCVSNPDPSQSHVPALATQPQPPPGHAGSDHPSFLRPKPLQTPHAGQTCSIWLTQPFLPIEARRAPPSSSTRKIEVPPVQQQLSERWWQGAEG